jgi:hypothetical protein
MHLFHSWQFRLCHSIQGPVIKDRLALIAFLHPDSVQALMWRKDPKSADFVKFVEEPQMQGMD